MRLRIAVSRILIKTGKFITSLPIAIMRPEDLREFSRLAYERSAKFNLEVEPGLNENEKAVLEKIPHKSGKFLILGVGAGREVIPLVQRGHQVTGVDYIPELLQALKNNAEKHSVSVEIIDADFTEMSFKRENYDIIWLSTSLYSSIPTQKKRLEVLERLSQGLRKGGYLVCFFHRQEVPCGKVWKIRKLLAWITLGNVSYEKGDLLWLNTDFMHAFKDESAIREELEKSGMKIEHVHLSGSTAFNAVILKKDN